MTTLYRSVLIETAVQAEALPIGTVAISSEMDDAGHTMHWAAVKVGLDVWARTDVADGQPLLGDAAMVDPLSPWSALVPIEVGIEHLRESGGRRRQKTLYVTPWRQSTGPVDEAPALADCGDQE